MVSLALRNAVRRLSDGQRRFTMTIQALTLHPGDRRGVVGPSGCGKTTAMDMLALAARPDSADAVSISNAQRQWVDLRSADEEALTRIRSRAMGYVLQTPNLLPFLTVEENIMLTQQLIGKPDRRFAHKLMSALGVEVPPSVYPSALSVGQRQRVAIARALSHRPAFVLADEPTAALDPDTAGRVMRLLVDLAKEQGAAVLVISHDQNLLVKHGFELMSVRFRALGNEAMAEVDEGVRA
jgi:putative ABC transport system ATP-binding protein